MIQRKHKATLILLEKFAKSFSDFDETVRSLHGIKTVEDWVRAGTTSGKNSDGTFFSAFKSKNPGKQRILLWFRRGTKW